VTALASPFDILAGAYDETFTRTDLGRRLRTAVWRHLDAAFAPGARVLELGCGTGEDALHLASRGVQVVATDASAAMIQETARKAHEAGHDSLVTAQVLSFEELPGAEPLLGPFDGAFSNFGAVNCAADPAALAGALGRLLAPSSPLLLVALGRYVPWEWAWFLGRVEPARAFRRLARGGLTWRGLAVRYPSPHQLASAFSPWFRRRNLVALGALLPPSYAAPSVAPRTLAFLDRWERRLEGVFPLAWLADHYLLEMERR
jgi:SAM-dependent methyltransferase